MGARLKALARKARALMPGPRDVHLYGGALLMALALAQLHWAVGLGMFGAYLVYIGRPWR